MLVGVAELCRGLRTNSTLKQLHLSYCGIDASGGDTLADVLANARSGLEVLNVNGNRLGGVGLQGLCRGLMVNTRLSKLMLADNQIDQVPEEQISYFDCILFLADCLHYISRYSSTSV
jgi:hypothetical protein